MQVLARQVGDLVEHMLWHDKWHSIAEAVDGLTDSDLTFKPVPDVAWDWDWDAPQQDLRIMTIRAHLAHLTGGADVAADAIAARTDDPVEDEHDHAGPIDVKGPPDGQVARLDIAFRRLLARARTLSDADLWAPNSLPEPEAELGKLYVLVEYALIHAPWHLGTIAKLLQWREALGRDTSPVAPPSKPEYRVPSIDPGRWTFPTVATRAELLVAITEVAHRTSPWHSALRVYRRVTREELDWCPLRTAEEPWAFAPARVAAVHVPACKVIYANQAFGDAALTWDDVAGILETDGWSASPDETLRAMDVAQEYLAEAMGAADDAMLDRTNPMHHGVPLTGWQVGACMVAHDAWHAGQVSLLRDAYAGMAQR